MPFSDSKRAREPSLLDDNAEQQRQNKRQKRPENPVFDDRKPLSMVVAGPCAGVGKSNITNKLLGVDIAPSFRGALAVTGAPTTFLVSAKKEYVVTIHKTFVSLDIPERNTFSHPIEVTKLLYSLYKKNSNGLLRVEVSGPFESLRVGTRITDLPHYDPKTIYHPEVLKLTCEADVIFYVTSRGASSYDYASLFKAAPPVAHHQVLINVYHGEEDDDFPTLGLHESADCAKVSRAMARRQIGYDVFQDASLFSKVAPAYAYPELERFLLSSGKLERPVSRSTVHARLEHLCGIFDKQSAINRELYSGIQYGIDRALKAAYTDTISSIGARFHDATQRIRTLAPQALHDTSTMTALCGHLESAAKLADVSIPLVVHLRELIMSYQVHAAERLLTHLADACRSTLAETTFKSDADTSFHPLREFFALHCIEFCKSLAGRDCDSRIAEIFASIERYGHALHGRMDLAAYRKIATDIPDLIVRATLALRELTDERVEAMMQHLAEREKSDEIAIPYHTSDPFDRIYRDGVSEIRVSNPVTFDCVGQYLSADLHTALWPRSLTELEYSDQLSFSLFRHLPPRTGLPNRQLQLCINDETLPPKVTALRMPFSSAPHLQVIWCEPASPETPSDVDVIAMKSANDRLAILAAAQEKKIAWTTIPNDPPTFAPIVVVAEEFGPPDPKHCVLFDFIHVKPHSKAPSSMPAPTSGEKKEDDFRRWAPLYGNLEANGKDEDTYNGNSVLQIYLPDDVFASPGRRRAYLAAIFSLHGIRFPFYWELDASVAGHGGPEVVLDSINTARFIDKLRKVEVEVGQCVLPHFLSLCSAINQFYLEHSGVSLGRASQNENIEAYKALGSVATETNPPRLSHLGQFARGFDPTLDTPFYRIFENGELASMIRCFAPIIAHPEMTMPDFPGLTFVNILSNGIAIRPPQ